MKLKNHKKFNLKNILDKAFFLFDYIPDAIYYKNTRNKIIRVNDYYCKIVGIPKEQIENFNAHEIYPKSLAKKYWEYDEKVIKTKLAQIDVEEEWNTKSGTKYVLCSRIPIRDQSEKVIGILGIAKDINERKMTESRLKESEEKFRTITDNAIMGICIIQDNQIKYCNDRFSKILGYTPKEINNWKYDDIKQIIHPEDKSIVLEQLQQKQEGKKEVLENYEYRLIKKDGEVIWIHNYSKSITFQGLPADLITIVDITDNKKAQEELISLNKLRSELLSRTSHELKTPLFLIQGYSELFREKNKNNLTKESEGFLDMIDKGVNKLKTLIEQIMDASKVKAKKLRIHKISNNLSDLIRVCLYELDGLIKLRSHKIILDIDEDLIFNFDYEAIFQVLENMISNAIKFTPPNGQIEINTQKNKENIIVSVKDNGIGFEEEEKAYLFSEFGKIERYGDDVDVLVKGSGLGLYISKYIIELHGGEVWMKSEGRNKGSTFFFSLPQN